MFRLDFRVRSSSVEDPKIRFKIEIYFIGESLFEIYHDSEMLERLFLNLNEDLHLALEQSIKADPLFDCDQHFLIDDSLFSNSITWFIRVDDLLDRMSNRSRFIAIVLEPPLNTAEKDVDLFMVDSLSLPWREM